MRQAVLLCGGLGSRLMPLTETIPKPLVPISGKPLLAYQLASLARAGVTHVYLNLFRFPEKVCAFVGDGSEFGLSVTYAHEPYPLGTAGALRLFADLLHGSFFVVYSDVLTEIDGNELLSFHEQSGAPVTAVVRRSNHPKDSDLVEVEGTRITRLFPKPHTNVPKGALAVAAQYVIDASILSELPTFTPADIFHDLLLHLWRNDVPLAAYETSAFMSDVGTLERLASVEKHLSEGRIPIP